MCTILLLMTGLVALSAVAAQGQTAQGAERWERTSLTVAVADEQAWSGTDVEAALAQWAPVMPMRLVQGPADVVLSVAPAVADNSGAIAYRETTGAVIESCRIDLSTSVAGQPVDGMLVHELGHCLGLGHSTLADTHEPRVMYRMTYGTFFSPTVTDGDLDAVRALYR